MEINRLKKPHNYQKDTLKITLNGREVTSICREANAAEGWVELLITTDILDDGGRCYLADDYGAVTHTAHGVVVITGELIDDTSPGTSKD